MTKKQLFIKLFVSKNLKAKHTLPPAQCGLYTERTWSLTTESITYSPSMILDIHSSTSSHQILCIVVLKV